MASLIKENENYKVYTLIRNSQISTYGEMLEMYRVNEQCHPNACSPELK